MSNDNDIVYTDDMFYKDDPSDKVYRVETGEIGPVLFSFDKKTVFNLWTDYPYKFTKEQKEIFDKDQPYWANFFKDRK